MSDDAREALQHCNPNCSREDWLALLFAYKDGGGTEEEFLDWSSAAPNFNRRDAETSWRNAKPLAGGITVATLFKRARDEGAYKPGNGAKVGNGAGGGVQLARVPASVQATRERGVDPAAMLAQCGPVEIHPYLTHKGIKPHGALVTPGGLLAFAFMNEAGDLQTVQTIAPDGTKRFHAGAKQRGSVWIAGEPKWARIVAVAEGVATACAIHEATGYPVLAAGSRGALPRAASIARSWAPDARVIVCADLGDLSTPREAARAVGGFLALPGGEDSADGYDFNDWRLDGATDDQIRERIESATLAQASEQARGAWGNLLDFGALADKEPEAPQFIMAGVPVGAVTGVFGHGGAGKSWIELHRAVCIALGIDFFGVPTVRRRVLFLACEDRASVLHWRLFHICRSLGVALRDLAGSLYVLDLVGCDAILYAPSHEGDYRAALGKLQSRIAEFGAEVIFIDGTTHTFGGEENKRTHVTAYVNLAAGLVPVCGAGILIGHVDKLTAKAGDTSEGYSGSTAWHNAVRSRIYLHAEVESGGEGDSRPRRTGRLFLEVQKGNYGGTGARIVLTWDAIAHTFAGKLDVATSGGMVEVIRDRNERQGILDALSACTAREHVPAALTGPRSAYNVLSAASEFPATLRGGTPAKRRFWAHVEWLRHRGDIVVEERRGSDRHTIKVLLPGPNAGNPNA